MDYVGEPCILLFFGAESTSVNRGHVKTKGNVGIEGVFMCKNLLVTNAQVADDRIVLVLGVPLEIVPSLSYEIAIFIWAIESEQDQGFFHHLFGLERDL